MERDNVRLCKQRIEVDILRNHAACLVRIQIVRQHVHAKRLCDAAFGLTDAAKTNDADRFALELDERIVPVAPVGVIGPVARVDRLAVMADVVADLEQQGNRELADGGGAIGRDVADGNPLFLRVIVVDNVVARGQNRNQFDIRALVNCFLRDGGLVHDHDLGVSNALGNEGRLLISRAVINRNFAQCFKPFPAQISGVFGVAVQNNNFHGNTSRFKIVVLHVIQAAFPTPLFLSYPVSPILSNCF